MFNYSERLATLKKAQQEIQTAVQKDFETIRLVDKRTELTKKVSKINEQYVEALKELAEFEAGLTQITDESIVYATKNVDTHGGWKRRGFDVRGGETATNIGGINFFHFTQTTGFGV